MQGTINSSGIHAALSLEILARQGTLNDHLMQWLLVEFQRSKLETHDPRANTQQRSGRS